VGSRHRATPTHADGDRRHLLDPMRPRRSTAPAGRMGFFALSGHGVEARLRERVLAAGRELFALPEEAKERVALRTGGNAWRGWFPFEGELTSGVPDLKEGFYVGRELPAPTRVRCTAERVARTRCRRCGHEVTAWMEAMEELGQRVLVAMATARPRTRTGSREPHRRSDRAVPHLPLPTRTPWRRRPLGRRRAQRLRHPHAARARRHARARGQGRQRVGRRRRPIRTSSSATSATCSTGSPPGGTAAPRTGSAT
jgi:hypothetical protein